MEIVVPVSKLLIFFGRIVLLYGANGQGKSFLFKALAGFYSRRNRQGYKINQTPGRIESCDNIFAPLLYPNMYCGYFSTNNALRMANGDGGGDDQLTVRQYTKFYMHCLRHNHIYKNDLDILEENGNLMDNDFFTGILDIKIGKLSDGQRCYLKLLLFILSNKLTPVWLLDEPFINMDMCVTAIFCSFFAHMTTTYETSIVVTSHQYPHCLMDIVTHVSFMHDREILFAYSKQYWYTRLNEEYESNRHPPASDQALFANTTSTDTTTTITTPISESQRINDINIGRYLPFIFNVSKYITNGIFTDEVFVRRLKLNFIDNCDGNKRGTTTVAVEHGHNAGGGVNADIDENIASFDSVNVHDFSLLNQFKLIGHLMSVKFFQDFKSVKFYLSLCVSVLLINFFRGIDNFTVFDISKMSVDMAFSFDSWNYDFMLLFSSGVANFFIILYVCFIFKNEFTHCNLEMYRGLYSPDILFFYRMLYAFILCTFIVCFDMGRDILSYDLPVASYLAYSTFSILYNVVLGIQLAFYCNNKYANMVIVTVLSALRIFLIPRFLYTILSCDKDDCVIKPAFQRVYFLLCSALDGEFANVVSMQTKFGDYMFQHKFNYSEILEEVSPSTLSQNYIYIGDVLLGGLCSFFSFVNLAVIIWLGTHYFTKRAYYFAP